MDFPAQGGDGHWKKAKMLFPKDEIIADVDRQIKKMGGKYSDWCVGIAKDSQEPFFQAHLLALWARVGQLPVGFPCRKG
jgi:hypothetical protein